MDGPGDDAGPAGHRPGVEFQIRLVFGLNGTYALIGAYGVSDFRGTAYLYNLSTGAWTDLATTAGQPVTGLGSIPTSAIPWRSTAPRR